MPAFSTRFALAAACLLISAAAQAKEAPEPFALQPGTELTAGADSTLDWSNSAAFKGVRRVVVPEFSIEFLQGNAAGSSAGKASVAQQWRLEGVGPAEFQAITDAAYAQLLATLQAAGFDVVGAQTMRAHPAFAKMQAQGKPSGHATGAGLAMAPAGMLVMPLGTVGQRSDGGALGGALKTLQTFSAVSSAISGGFDTQEMARGLDATVLQLHLAVDFSQVGAKRGLLQRMSGKAEVSGKAQPSIAAGAQVRFMTPATQGATLQLARPLLLPEDTFNGTREATSSATKTANVAGALLRFAAGVGGGHETVEYEVSAEPEQYKRRLIEGLGQFNAAVAARLAAAR